MAQRNPTDDGTTGKQTEINADDGTGFNDLRGQTVPFAGLTRHSTMTPEELLPEGVFGHGSSMKWWAKKRNEMDVNADPEADSEVLPDNGLYGLIHDLPRVTEAEAGWKDPLTDEMHQTDKHNALVDPDRLRALHNGAALDTDDVLAYIPTTSYEVIPPATALEPLGRFLRDEGAENAVFGEIRIAEEIGGGASMDVFVDGEHVTYPGLDDAREPIVAGIEIEWDFKGNRSFRARGMMMDMECLNSLRAVTNWEVVKHAGDLSRMDFYEWYEDLWSAIDAKRDVLADMIEAATEQTLDLSDFPADFDAEFDSPLEAFYVRAGLPTYLGQAAARNASSNASNPFEPTYWTLHRGATFAITHHARGEVRGGGSITEHHRVAKDILMNPVQVQEQVEEDYELQQAAAADDGELSEEQVAGIAQVSAAFDGVNEMKDRYEERAEEIEQLIETTE